MTSSRAKRQIKDTVCPLLLCLLPLAWVLLPGFLLYAGELPSGLNTPDSAGAEIGNIRIVRHDVFDTVRGNLQWLQKLANKLHIKSRENVIRRELLFAAGGRIQPDLLAESERNLRKLRFIGKVTVTAERPLNRERQNNVIVVTQDQWTTLAEFSAGREGDRNSFRIGVAERNFLGNGQNLALRYKVRDTGNFFVADFDETRLLNSRWALHLQKVQGEDRNFFNGMVLRPLFSLDTRWSLGFEMLRGSAKSRWYEGGTEADAYRSGAMDISSFVLRSFGSRYRKTNVWIGHGYYKAEFSPYVSTRNHLLVGPDDEYHKFGIGFERDHFSYVEETRIDRFSRVEDLKLGSRWRGNIFLAHRLSLAGRTRPQNFPMILIGHDRALALPGHQYFLGSASISVRIEAGRQRHRITQLDLKYYNRTIPWQTLAGHIELFHGHNLDNGWQYLLGGDEGLRGFPAFRFSGQKLLLANFENRIFTPWELLWTGLGAAVFVDGGYVWKSDERMRLRDMHWSAGVGLRLALTKSAGSKVVRFDLARAFDGSG